MMLASKSGLQEKYIEALNRKHFMEAKSASRTETVLEAAEEAGMDKEHVVQFLSGDEFTADVWESYRRTIDDMGIHSIPLFAFSLEGHERGRPFGSADKAWQINGAQGPEAFLEVFRAAAAEAARKGELKKDLE
mmetsp:Transcript_43803/g.103560  ORF Transcript_43803/g.103560 Transcript_43803/m.103560 type:complete len:134 (-) Transcript_43803:463-864(-)